MPLTRGEGLRLPAPDVYNGIGRPDDAQREAAAARRLERAAAGS